MRNILNFGLFNGRAIVLVDTFSLDEGTKFTRNQNNAAAGYVDMLLWHVWRCMEKYDAGPKLGVRRKRLCAEDSAAVRGKRPDFCLLSNRALLFKGEDRASATELHMALEDLSDKLKEWGAVFHGQVLQADIPLCKLFCMRNLIVYYQTTKLRSQLFGVAQQYHVTAASVYV